MALHLPLPSLESPSLLLRSPSRNLPLPPSRSQLASPAAELRHFRQALRRRHRPPVLSAGKEETELLVSSTEQQQDPNPEDLEYVSQIKRVLELLKKNRDMTVGEVKLIIAIEDPRDTERKRLLGIEDLDEVSRDDLVDALQEVHEGRVPENRVALRLLAEEMIQWPDLEVEPTKSKRTKSLYAKATDTGVDPREAARRLNVDWDSAANIEVGDETDDLDVPPVVGYGALYLVTALPVIIGVSVVLILFYNSLQ